MSYKIDTVISMLDEILMRLNRIEKLIEFNDEDAPEDVEKTFDRLFDKKVDKPTLFVVKSDKSNVVDFDKHD